MSFDTVAENRAFAEKFAFPYPLLSDSTRGLGLACGAAESATAANAKRVTVVLDPDGKVLQVHAKVDARSHPASLLASL